MYIRHMGESNPALEAIYRPVRRQTTVAATEMRLGTAIRLGVLAPGSQLPPERDLAGQLGINRSTLRLAVTTLVQSGYLVAVRGGAGGTFVPQAPPPSVGRGAKPLGDDARALLDQRVAIETGATVLATERAEPADLDRLDEPVERMAAAKTFEDYRRADVCFHIGVAEAAHSLRLVTAMTEVHGQVSDLIARIAHPKERLTRSNGQHRRLVTLLRRGDSSLAALLMREHIERTEHVLERSGPAVSTARPEAASLAPLARPG